MYASATKQKKQIKAMAIVPFFCKFANKSEIIYKTALLYLITKSIINNHTHKKIIIINHL